ncbi:GspE/PulE family protein [Pseudoalteromonas maricaloris]|uniref:GspE/PulE family protein n=1 Tax=Pseudoalteromonas maricaloris TaxID=184924 RepID=UPI00057F7FC4|nr:GspE/PulE family protein [Pseudoalteromonas flavipulchra]KID36121.1 secretion system protein E [Pseudoalteromonas flavipulchra NCIMB 2033 = ATCC BAA-314]MBD0780290.1 type II/IV secretion system protein [Pseudoalteromonas flavipulchra]MBE0371542.1 general secretion pathway protein E [Pseudoalteromonas flavipulchra NCIMB 2033 = ATCC BAA-314]
MSLFSDFLVHNYELQDSDVRRALTYQEKFGGKLEEILVNMGILDDSLIPDILASYLELSLFDINSEFSVFVEYQYFTYFASHNWLVLRGENETLEFVTSDPLNPVLNNWLAEHEINCTIKIASESVVKSILSEYSTNKSNVDEVSSGSEEQRLRDLASEAPIVNLLNSLMTRALREGASDMHIEPFRGRCRVRYRVDGVLLDIEKLPSSMQLPVVTRLKILSGMDIAEKRRPQDGKIELKLAGQEIDIRVSALPVNEGESVVMRFLRKENVTYDINVLGLSSDIETALRADIKKTAGVILMTGPTGSGKTTTLYTFLNELNNDDVKIITLEDPVEYQLPGINQVQVNSDIGFTFASGLRSIVRQDPDVIMLGEIRDKETAQIALQSALTGHLVFSTVHTNDAASAYTRLLDLGVEEFLLNAALVSIVAQRLVRKNCSHCSEPVNLEQEIIEKYLLHDLADKCNETLQPKAGVGCENCGFTGFKGRLAIIEYLPCDDFIRSTPKDNNFVTVARQHNLASGRRTLVEDGLLKVIKGQTTIAEVLRVAG